MQLLKTFCKSVLVRTKKKARTQKAETIIERYDNDFLRCRQHLTRKGISAAMIEIPSVNIHHHRIGFPDT